MEAAEYWRMTSYFKIYETGYEASLYVFCLDDSVFGRFVFSIRFRNGLDGNGAIASFNGAVCHLLH